MNGRCILASSLRTAEKVFRTLQNPEQEQAAFNRSWMGCFCHFYCFYLAIVFVGLIYFSQVLYENKVASKHFTLSYSCLALQAAVQSCGPVIKKSGQMQPKQHGKCAKVNLLWCDKKANLYGRQTST